MTYNGFPKEDKNCSEKTAHQDHTYLDKGRAYYCEGKKKFVLGPPRVDKRR